MMTFILWTLGVTAVALVGFILISRNRNRANTARIIAAGEPQRPAATGNTAVDAAATLRYQEQLQAYQAAVQQNATNQTPVGQQATATTVTNTSAPLSERLGKFFFLVEGAPTQAYSADTVDSGDKSTRSNLGAQLIVIFGVLAIIAGLELGDIFFATAIAALFIAPAYLLVVTMVDRSLFQQNDQYHVLRMKRPWWFIPVRMLLTAAIVIPITILTVMNIFHKTIQNRLAEQQEEIAVIERAKSETVIGKMKQEIVVLQDSLDSHPYMVQHVSLSNQAQRLRTRIEQLTDLISAESRGEDRGGRTSGRRGDGPKTKEYREEQKNTEKLLKNTEQKLAGLDTTVIYSEYLDEKAVTVKLIAEVNTRIENEKRRCATEVARIKDLKQHDDLPGRFAAFKHVFTHSIGVMFAGILIFFALGVLELICFITKINREPDSVIEWMRNQRETNEETAETKLIPVREKAAIAREQEVEYRERMRAAGLKDYQGELDATVQGILVEIEVYNAAVQKIRGMGNLNVNDQNMLIAQIPKPNLPPGVTLSPAVLGLNAGTR